MTTVAWILGYQAIGEHHPKEGLDAKASEPFLRRGVALVNPIHDFIACKRGHVAEAFEEGFHLSAVVLHRAGLQVSTWEVCI